MTTFQKVFRDRKVINGCIAEFTDSDPNAKLFRFDDLFDLNASTLL